MQFTQLLNIDQLVAAHDAQQGKSIQKDLRHGFLVLRGTQLHYPLSQITALEDFPCCFSCGGCPAIPLEYSFIYFL